MTLLIPDCSFGAAERAGLATHMMREGHLGAEQVGYVDTAASPPRLDMMGGELCVNACRAMAALLHAEGRLTLAAPPVAELPASEGSGWSYGLLRSSGVDEPVVIRARCRNGDGNGFPIQHEAGVCLRLGPAPEITAVADDMHVVRLPGITHLILDAPRHRFPKDWRDASAALRRRFSLETEEAVGCIWLDAAVPSLAPVVWVRGTGHSVLETACGSGTLACALYLADRHPDYGHTDTIHIQQYGEEVLDVTLYRSRSFTGVPPGGARQSLWAWISGTVDCVARGECFVPTRSV